MSTALFIEFVDVVFGGNRSSAAAALCVDKSTVSRICNEERGISPALARRIEVVSDGRYAKERFIWPEDASESQSPVRANHGDIDEAA